MRAEEFGGWKANNVGKGGKRPSYDQFNKSSKGHERNPAAKEFASQGLEGYHHYSEFVDTRTEKDDDKKKDNSSSNSSQSSKTNSASKVTNHSSSLIRNIVSRVAVAAIGAVVVVNEYQVVQQHEEEKFSTVASVTWNWSEDNQNATIGLFNNDENLIKELPTTIYISQEDPTCTKDGLITYIATAVDEDGKTYTDTHTETLPALGHDYVLIEEKLENGKIIRVYECSKCHERVTITISADEVE